MKCPECKTLNPDGQEFCRSCRYKLKDASAESQPAVSPDDEFSGQGGSGLIPDEDITLARSGLITHIDQKTSDILGYQPIELKGKPLSLFVEHADLVIFFSNLNEVLNNTEKREFEIALKHKNKKNIYVKLEFRTDHSASKPIDTIHIALEDITDSYMAAAQMQAQQDLLGLIFTITNEITTINSKHLTQSIQEALKKICLFTKADRCFIYSFNRPLFRLDPLYEWRQPIAPLPGVKVKPKNVSLSKIKHTMEKLRQEKNIIVNDIDSLESIEREELLGWHYTDMKAVMCHMIYSEKNPIGIIGVARDSADGKWESDYVSLVKFFGDFISTRLSLSDSNGKTADKPQPVEVSSEKAKRKLRADAPENIVDISDLDPDLYEEFKSESAKPPAYASRQNGWELTKSSQSMVLSKSSDSQAKLPRSVFPRDDGMVSLTCPRCGIEEQVSVGKFKPLGIAIRVMCPCSNQFNVMLEKRRVSRKSVQLEGYFSVSEDLEPDAGNSIWGPMIVNDLSKTGIQFSSGKAKLIKPGDPLMLRFNLDNPNRALIYKKARVISVSGNKVRCQFEGADSYDITLGFYFM